MKPGTPCPGSSNGPRHDFKSFVKSTVPPNCAQMKAADLENYNDADAVAQIVESLTGKEYVVVCQACGMVAVEPDEEPEPSRSSLISEPSSVSATSED